jgi:hypothetical protein
MGAGIWNVIFGLAFMAGGLSGKLVLLGTQSSQAAAVVGGLMAAWGASQLYRARHHKD